MGILSPTSVQYWLPAGYILVVSLVQFVRWWTGPSRGHGKTKVIQESEDIVDSINAPLLQEEDRSKAQSGGHSITATGFLWAALSLCYAQFVYQGVRAVLEAFKHGVDTTLFVTGTTLFAAWLLATLAVNHDHWYHAFSPPVLDGTGRPRRQRMWWALWPFFNLSLITTIVAFWTEDRPTYDGLTDVVKDDRLWSLVAMLMTLLFVTYLVLVGSEVHLCEREPNAEFKAGLISTLFFHWFSPVINEGQKKQLDLEDLPVQIDQDLAGCVWTKFETCSSQSPFASLSSLFKCCSRRGRSGDNGGSYTAVEGKSSDDKKGRVLWQLFRLIKPLLLSQGMWHLLTTGLEFVPTLAMQQIVNFVSNYKGEGVSSQTTFFVVLLFAGPVFQGIADGRKFHLGRRIGCRVRGALVGSVFRKMLRMDMSNSAFSSGELTNLMSVDSELVMEFSPYTHFIWATALEVIISVGLLFYILGPSALGGVAFMVATIPLGKWSTGKTQKFQETLMKRKDERMSVVGEIMQGIRIIKLFAWEKDFKRKVREARKSEVRSLRSYMLMFAGVSVQWNTATTLVGLCTFIVHTRLLGKTLTASQGFTSLSLFSILRFPLLVLPEVINFFLQALVSLNRVEAFLDRDDLEGHTAVGSFDTEAGGDSGSENVIGVGNGSVQVSDGTFSWPAAAGASKDEGDEDPSEENKEEEAQKDHAVNPHPSPSNGTINDGEEAQAEAGGGDGVPDGGEPPPTLSNLNLEVGAGELVCIYGPTGCGKSSLLLAILGEVERLGGSVKVQGSVAYAAQRAWIQNATLRDNVLFGLPMDWDRYNRTMAACALTSDLDLLEAGDMTEIGEKGVNLSGGQQQRVSLARAVYADADVYLLDDVLSAVDAHVGEHIFKNCIRGLLRNKAVVMVTHQVPMTARYAHRVVLMGANGTVVETGDPHALQLEKGSRLGNLLTKVGGRGTLLRQRSVSSGIAESAGSKADLTQEQSHLIKEEGRQHGSPGLVIYLQYANAAGGIVMFLIPYLVLHVSYNGLQFGQNMFLSRWVNKLEADEDDNDTMWEYIAISFAVIVAIFSRCVFESLASLKASVRLHDAMAERVMHAPVGWFEKTPLGRILNRFSSDIEGVDKEVMDGLRSTVACAFSAASIVVVIGYTVPFLILFLVPISVIAVMVGTQYLNASRELKRLDSVSKSPIFAHFSESVAGVSTIRAFGVQERFVMESCRRVDTCNRAHFYLWVSNRWFNVRIQIIGAIVSVLAGSFVVWWGKDHIKATVAGLALLYALQFTDALKFLVRQHATLEMEMNSVERILEYTDKLPQEAPATIEDRCPPPNWPSEGALSVRNLTLKYPSTETPVIEGMSFDVEPYTRVGIVGRTGAGKSSLMTVLFRLVEPQPGSVVEIDGVDTLSMGLEDLRSKLAIVPQDPILFRGTVRSNMDPFGDYSDAAMWDALRQAHIDTSISSSGGLDAPIGENGGNLSVGERQLMCMARALLRQSSILVMDEATANVDPETDILIQATMREEFRNCTVLCIAHRLHTIIYYEKVMVLERGRLMEYAAPATLLNDPNSLFHALCEKTGALEELKATARGEVIEVEMEGEGEGNGAEGGEVGSS